MSHFSRLSAVLLATVVAIGAGCGSTKSRLGTEQLLASDAVDRAVSQIDFRPLRDQTVFLDTKYLKTDSKRAIGYVDGDYVISSLRQQVVGAGCLLKDSADEADFVIEARIGALGSDDRNMVYGIPASNALSAAASAAAAISTSAPPIPAIPEISIARREDHAASAKVSCFAYHRETRRPVWQSGLAIARSKAKNTYIFGAGPFQKGEIYDGIRFAGEDLKSTLIPYSGDQPEAIALSETHMFNHPSAFVEPEADGVVTVGHEEDAEPKSEK